jgi:hypothetical protein
VGHLLIAPLVEGLSGRTLDLPRRFSPNAVTTAFCFSVEPITDLFSVT